MVKISQLKHTVGSSEAWGYIPPGPDSKILGHTVGSSEANFEKLLHFKCMYDEAIRTFLVVSLSGK